MGTTLGHFMNVISHLLYSYNEHILLKIMHMKQTANEYLVDYFGIRIVVKRILIRIFEYSFKP